ncbi:MAG TPA: endonuclease III [Veillonellaceae bacterium]|jgi:endonuclease-3|nr:endonuclease III [Veillonellaceae bacterium]
MKVTAKIKKDQLSRLSRIYGNEKTALHYSNPFTFLVAVMLSAQCTDVRVNLITARIFPRLDSPEKMAALTQEQLEQEIRDCGLYHAKARHILETSRMILDEYRGEVPHAFADLLRLPGVGRKTANVVQSVLWNVPAIAVDTHVFRVANRLGLACGKTPLEVEEQLQKVIPRSDWSAAHHWLIWHGRKICHARNPECSICPMCDICPSSAAGVGKNQKKI